MQVDEYGAPVWLESGVRCGSHGAQRVYHESAAAVRTCYAVMRAEMAEQQALQEAEARNERWFEDRGYWEARAQEEYEERMGVIPFSEAYRMACPELFTEEDAA